METVKREVEDMKIKAITIEITGQQMASFGIKITGSSDNNIVRNNIPKYKIGQSYITPI